MERAILGCIFEDRLSFLHNRSHHIVKLHQDSPMSNSEQIRLMILAQIFILYYVFLDNKFQEFKTTSVNVSPTLTLIALVLPHAFVLFLCHLLPSYQRFSFKNSSTFLSN
jgi:hypothetical protein